MAHEALEGVRAAVDRGGGGEEKRQEAENAMRDRSGSMRDWSEGIFEDALLTQELGRDELLLGQSGVAWRAKGREGQLLGPGFDSDARGIRIYLED